MAQSQFSLLWNAHKNNICNGLCALQQNGEFVDMTLAADGHLVKVHQVIIALASPYIKELISSAQCSHPVVFLNKISYKTLCSILEYVYTGEVLVSIESLNEFLQAGKELHIKGLEDMKIYDSINSNQSITQEYDVNRDCDIDTLTDDLSYYEMSKCNSNEEKCDVVNAEHYTDMSILDTNEVNTDDGKEDAVTDVIKPRYLKPDSEKALSVMQYTVSNQGSLQMILNRYVYYLKHTNRNNTRQWRCVDYLTNIKCPAHVITKDETVSKRISAHIHPFHDKRILKKVRAGVVYTAINEAELEGKLKKNQLHDE